MAVSIEQAKLFAAALRELVKPGLLGVEVFGSVAREGKGDDLDLIVLATDDLVDEWIGAVISLIGNKDNPSCYSEAAVRREAFSMVFRNSHVAQLRVVPGLWDRKVDYFVFPCDWRQRLHALQLMLPHEDPDFMANLARDARPI